MLRPALLFLAVTALHGEADQSVPFEQAVAFQAKLRAHGVRCDLLRLPGAPHRLADWEKFLPDYRDRLVAWLHEMLPPSP